MDRAIVFSLGLWIVALLAWGLAWITNGLWFGRQSGWPLFFVYLTASLAGYLLGFALAQGGFDGPAILVLHGVCG